MAFNGSGVYIPPVTTFSPAVGNTTIDSSAQNTLTADLAAALTTCLTKDGQTTPTTNLPMATFRHTGVGNATSLTTYASADDVVDNTLLYAGASAVGTDAYAVALPISPVAYKTGHTYSFLSDVANTGACSVNFNSIGVKSIKLANGSDPYDNCILASSPVHLFYDGTNFILLNPAYGSDGYNEGITLGTVEANKVVTADTNGNVTSGTTVTLAAAGILIETGALVFPANKEIELDFSLVGIAATVIFDLDLQINSDTTLTNYWRSVSTDGAAAVKANEPSLGPAAATIQHCAGSLRLIPNSTKGTIDIVYQCLIHNPGASVLSIEGSMVYDNGAAITKLGLFSRAGGGALTDFGIGSRITVRMVN